MQSPPYMKIPYLNQISAATNRNDHNTAMEYGLKAIGLEENTLNEKLEILVEIKKKHEKIGHMTYELAQEGHLLYKFMMTEAESRMDKGSYSLFYSCF